MSNNEDTMKEYENQMREAQMQIDSAKLGAISTRTYGDG